jgi:beta-1,4-N-acetylglucosaminyltransferase
MSRELDIVYSNAGGHTAEMLMLVEGMDKAFYSPRVYVAAETDKMSAKRALSREQTWAGSQVRAQGNNWRV